LQGKVKDVKPVPFRPRQRDPREHLQPLGLPAVGHFVKLVDAEFGAMNLPEIVSRTEDFDPDAVLPGHSGSTSCRSKSACRAHGLGHSSFLIERGE